LSVSVVLPSQVALTSRNVLITLSEASANGAKLCPLKVPQLLVEALRDGVAAI
jgi:hypothetical protein